MYRTIRILRIVISLVAMGVPTWALIAGYDSVFAKMQVMTALFSGAAFCLIFWAIVTLIYGRVYCSSICPLGTLMDCVSAIGRQSSKGRNGYKYKSEARRLRFLFLVLAIVSLMSSSALIPTLFDPYSAYARMVEEFIARPIGLAEVPLKYAVASISIAILTASVVVGVAWRHGRLLCNSVCPIGTILGMGSRRSYFHIEIDPNRCINCGECERVCKASCIKLTGKIVDNSRCVMCFNCTSVCPNGAINYKSGRYRLSMPMMQSLDTDTGGNRSETSRPLTSTCQNTKK